MRVLGIRRRVGWPQLGICLLAVLVGWYGLFDMLAVTSVPQQPAMHAVRRKPFMPLAAVQGAIAPPREINCGEVPCLALTFDDGPSPSVTPQVLDILARHHARATFFVIGVHVSGNEALLRRMHNEGHEIGNHSWSHADFTTLNGEQIEQQIAQTQAVITGAGVPAPKLFRPPYGAVNQVVKSHVPLTFAMWNDDPEDWKVKNPHKIIAEIEASAKPGRVVVMHDVHQETADALDPLLTDLQQHYQLVTMSQLFDLSPGQRGSFYGR